MSKETFFFMPKTSVGIKAKKVFKFSQRLFFRENSFTGFHLERKRDREKGDLLIGVLESFQRVSDSKFVVKLLI